VTVRAKFGAIVIALALEACCFGGGEDAVEQHAPEPTPVERTTDAVPDLVVGAEPVIVHVPAAPRWAFTVARPGEYAIAVEGADANAQLRLFSGESVVMQAGHGEATSPRLVTFLCAGDFEIQVSDWRSGALDAALSLSRLPPMTPAASIAPGDPAAIVACPSGASPREASTEITLAIATSGTYRIEASSPDGSRDAELALLEDGGLLQADSDSGEGTSAQIERALTAGSYTLRVRDWLNREASIHVVVAPTE
jgi:hypothetical protein